MGGCEARLISDAPASIDAFRSHAGIAQALAELMRRESGGRSIALAGPWGSGKSTVVELLKERLDSKDEALFVFDAWSHQGDPLRRAFLEEARRFLVNAQWIQQADLREEFDSLSHRINKARTNVTSILGWGGGIMAVLVFLAALGAAFVSKFKPDESGFWVGLVLFLSPLAVAFLMLIPFGIYRLAACVSPKKYSRDRCQNPLVLLWKRTREVQTSSGLQTPDPTSIEFASIFSRLLDQALQRKERRLVIVVDNLDRLDPEEARQAWSTMRTFFEPQSRSFQWQKLWLLVPFDPAGLARLWASTNGSSDASSQNLSQPNSDQLRDTFLSKTFQVVFRVPEPVSSDWETFLKAQLAAALPKHDTADFAKVTILFDHVRTPRPEPITPREIKLFVNRLGALHRQWQDAIPLVTQAAYVLFGDQLFKSSSDFLKPDLIPEKEQAVLADAEWREHLAAIHYNVEPERAMQVTVGNRLRLALTTGNVREVTSLQDMPGFVLACERIVSTNLDTWSKQEPQAIALTARALNDIEQPVLDERIWRYLWSASCNVSEAKDPKQRWTPLTKEVGLGLAAILAHANSLNLPGGSHVLLAGISHSAIGQDEKAASNWTEGALEVLNTIVRLDPNSEIAGHFQVPETFETYVYVIKSLQNQSAEPFRKHFRPSLEPSKCIETLVQWLDTAKFAELRLPLSTLIQWLLEVDIQWPWSPIIQRDVKVLNDYGQVNAPAVQGALDDLHSLARINEEARTRLREIANLPALFHHLNDVRGQIETAALCMLTALMFNPKGELSGQNGQSQNGQNAYRQLLSNPSKDPVLDSLARALARLGSLPNLLELSQVTEIKALTGALLNCFVQTPDLRHLITPDLVVGHYPVFRDCLSEDDKRTLIQGMCKQTELMELIVDKAYNPDLTELYVFVCESADLSIYGAWLSTVADSLKTLDKNVWQSEIVSEGRTLDLALILGEKNGAVGLGKEFQDALFQQAQQILSGASKGPTRLRGRWTTVLNLLTDDQRRLLLTNIRDVMLGTPRTVAACIEVYGSALAEDTLLTSEADKVVRLLFRKIIEERNEGALRWLAEVLQNERDVIQLADRASVADFRERVKELESDQGAAESLRALANRVAEFLNV